MSAQTSVDGETIAEVLVAESGDGGRFHKDVWEGLPTCGKLDPNVATTIPGSRARVEYGMEPCPVCWPEGDAP